MDSFDDGPLLSNSRILRLTAYSLVAYSRALHLRQFRAPRVPEPVLASAQADAALAAVLATEEWLCGECMGRRAKLSHEEAADAFARIVSSVKSEDTVACCDDCNTVSVVHRLR